MGVELNVFGLDSSLALQPFRPNKIMAERVLPIGIKTTVLISHFGHQIETLSRTHPFTARLTELLPTMYELSPLSERVHPQNSHRAMLIASGLTDAQLDRLVEKSDICRNMVSPAKNVYSGKIIAVPWMKKTEIPSLQFAHVTDTLTHMGITDIDIYGYSYGGYYLGLLAEHITRTSNIQVHTLNLELSATVPGSGNSSFIKEYHYKVAKLHNDVSDINPVLKRLEIMNSFPLIISPTYRLVNYFGVSDNDPALNQDMATDYLEKMCISHGVPYQLHIFPASIQSVHRIAEDQQPQVAKLLNQSEHY